jgi:hypothetical protein
MLSQEVLTRRQKEYLRIHLARTKGMIGELTAQKNLLQQQPQKVVSYHTHLQEIITTLLFNVDFIEKWPSKQMASR